MCTSGRGVRRDATCFLGAPAGRFPRYAPLLVQAHQCKSNDLPASHAAKTAACILFATNSRLKAAHVCHKRPYPCKPDY
jgi:hypothetical protein